jgi:hypothetical protein
MGEGLQPERLADGIDRSHAGEDVVMDPELPAEMSIGSVDW